MNKLLTWNMNNVKNIYKLIYFCQIYTWVKVQKDYQLNIPKGIKSQSTSFVGAFIELAVVINALIMHK